MDTAKMTPPIDYKNFCVGDEDLISIRKELYGSNSPGYYVFKNFIPENFINHMLHFWTNEIREAPGHKEIREIRDKKDIFYEGCPNYFYPNQYGHAYYNFGFNKPADEVTHSVSFSVNCLRNIIEAVNNYQYLFLTDKYSNGDGRHAWCYRSVFTKNGEKIVEPHRDWIDKANFNPAKLQATLFMSKKGIDYEGIGMKLESNNGKHHFVFDDDIKVNPGDLVLWKYNNLHSVENIKSSPSQLGFFRFIYPPEVFYPVKIQQTLGNISTKILTKEIVKRILRKGHLIKKA